MLGEARDQFAARGERREGVIRISDEAQVKAALLAQLARARPQMFFHFVDASVFVTEDEV